MRHEDAVSNGDGSRQQSAGGDVFSGIHPQSDSRSTGKEADLLSIWRDRNRPRWLSYMRRSVRTIGS